MAGSRSSLAFLVFGLVAQTFVFGFYTLLVLLSTRSLLRRQQRNKPRTILILVTLAMYLLTTLYWIYSVAFVADRVALVDQVLLVVQGVQANIPAQTSDTLAKLAPVVNAAILLNFVITDGILVWRAWLICHRTIRKYLFVAIGFLVLTTISLVTLISLHFATSLLSPSSISSGVIDAFQVITLAFSLASNIGATAVVGRTASRNLNVPFPGGEFRFVRTNPALALVAESGAVYIFSGLLLLISSLIRLQIGTLGDLYGPVAVQIAGGYPSALLLLITASGNSGQIASLNEKTELRLQPSSPTSLDFKSRPIGGDGDGDFKPRPLIPERVHVDLNLDSPKPTTTEFYIAPVADLNSNPSIQKSRPGVMSTEFALPAPVPRNRPRMGLLQQPQKKKVSFDVDDSSTEGNLTPALSVVSLPSGLAANDTLSDVPDTEDVMAQPQPTIAQPRPILARPPFPVIPETPPQIEPAALPMYAPKPSRVPIAVGALEYYQRRQQLGMMQAGMGNGSGHERSPSQSTVASENAPGLGLTSGGMAVGGQVVKAQGRDHPFPLRSQRFAAPALTPTTPQFMMMPDSRDQAALDALDLDLEMVLGSLETGSAASTASGSDIGDTESIATAEDTQPAMVVDTSLQVADNKLESNTENENENDNEAQTPTVSAAAEEAGVGLAFYLDEDESEADIRTPTQATPNAMSEPEFVDFTLPPLPPSPATPTMAVAEAPISVETPIMFVESEEEESSSIEPMVVVAVSTETPTMFVESEETNMEPMVVVPEVTEMLVIPQQEEQLQVPQQSQSQRSSIAKATMSQFPIVSSRSRSPSIESSSTSSAQSDMQSGQQQSHQRLRSQSHAARMNQFPVTSSRLQTPNSSRAPTPHTLHSTSQGMNQFPARSQTPSSRTATPTLSMTSSSSDSEMRHQRSKSQSNAQRTNQFPVAPPRSLTPTPSRASSVSSSASDLIGSQRSTSSPASVTDSEGANVLIATESELPLAAQKQQPARRQLKRVKSQPKISRSAVAAAISAPLTPEAVELEKERARRKALSRFSDDSFM
ncbi:hypothetical protein C8F01DRAFT_1102072 [Mycena amicta]|nr:hypothetical protein C8F01DRAFT_1102072 [Mycena amicta]